MAFNFDRKHFKVIESRYIPTIFTDNNFFYDNFEAEEAEKLVQAEAEKGSRVLAFTSAFGHV